MTARHPRQLVAAIALAMLAGCPEGSQPEQARSPDVAAPRLDPECARDKDCALLPYVTCCGECPPAPPFDVGTRQDLDAIFIEAEERCALDRRDCTPPVCEPLPAGCYARAACVAGQCVVEVDGCR